MRNIYIYVYIGSVQGGTVTTTIRLRFERRSTPIRLLFDALRPFYVTAC